MVVAYCVSRAQWEIVCWTGIFQRFERDQLSSAHVLHLYISFGLPKESQSLVKSGKIV